MVRGGGDMLRLIQIEFSTENYIMNENTNSDG